jgi:hypothetical protein
VSQAGAVAYAALLLWIPISLTLFFTMPRNRAALLTIFGGLLFLPQLAWFKIPLLPPLSKQSIPYLCVLLGYSLRARRRVWSPPKEWWVTLLTVIMVVGGAATGLTNGDVLTYGKWHHVVLPGLDFKDGMAIGLGQALDAAVPFFLGTVVVREGQDLEDLLAFLAAAGVVYSFFALIELRLSPQLHAWVYGYHQHPDFLQTLRFGGYRPMIFMAHGLAVALFFAVSALSATALLRTRRRVWGVSARWVSRWLAFIVVICKSTAAIVYSAVALPLTMFASPRARQRIASWLALFVILYPALRHANLFPTEGLLSAARLLGEDRAGSMEFRFENEEELLKKARERPWFGWGLSGRNEGYDEGGSVSTTTDGAWIISVGSTGIVGFLSLFGLLVLPIFVSRRRSRKLEDESQRDMLATLSLIVAITAIDLIPNGLFSNYPFFLSGALLSLSRVPSDPPSERPRRDARREGR